MLWVYEEEANVVIVEFTQNDEEHNRVVTVVGFGELEQIEDKNTVESWVFEELEQIFVGF